MPGVEEVDLLLFPHAGSAGEEVRRRVVRNRRLRRQRLLLRGPERVFSRKGEGEVGLERPIRGTGRVILLGHDEVRVAVAYRQHSLVIEDRLREPVAEVSQEEALEHPPGRDFLPGEGAGGEEG